MCTLTSRTAYQTGHGSKLAGCAVDAFLYSIGVCNVDGLELHFHKVTVSAQAHHFA